MNEHSFKEKQTLKMKKLKTKKNKVKKKEGIENVKYVQPKDARKI